MNLLIVKTGEVEIPSWPLSYSLKTNEEDGIEASPYVCADVRVTLLPVLGNISLF